MKKFLIGFGAVVVVVVATALIAPSFVDWNQYRARIASEASDALGRTVEIRGNVGLSLLPEPVIFVNDAHLANVEGASDSDMASLASLEVRIALAPLLAGMVRIESVKLVRPVVNLEVMEGGRSNMIFGRKIADARTQGLQPKIPLTTGVKIETSADGGLDISVDNFVIEKGTLIFRNSASGYVERIDDINGRFAFASLKGPLEAVASAVVRGIPVSLEIGTSAIIQGRTMPFNLDFAAGPGNVKAQFSGALGSMEDSPRLKGKLTLDGQNLKEFAGALGAEDLPDALQRPFGAVGMLSAGADGGEIADLSLRLDGTQAQGRVAVSLAGAITAEATLAVGRLDLDSLLAPVEQPSVARSAAPTKGTSLDLPTKSVRRAAAGGDGGLSLEALPADLSANANLTIEALTWRKDVVRQAKMNLALANREITVSQLSALLPGSADVALFGFVTEKDGSLQFDGTVDAATNDLRGLVEWLGVSTEGIASERLRRLGLNAKLSARPDVAALSDLHALLDGTKIDGAATVAFGERLSVGANLALDRLNLDAYLPRRAGAGAPPASATPPNGQPAAPSASAVANPLATLAPLAAFDANVRARMAALTLNGLPLNDVRLEAALLDGVLDMKSLSVADMAGVTASLSGAITGLKRDAGGASDPKFKDMVFDAKAKSLAALIRMSEIEAPVAPEALGASALTARLNGGLRALDVGLDIQTMGGRATFMGQVQARELLPRFDGRVALTHPDLARFVRGFGPDYRPRGVKGGIDVAGKIRGSVLELTLSELSGLVGGVRVQGGVGLALLGRKPRVSAQLATGDLDIDSFLPQKRTAGFDGRPRVQPAAFVAPAPAPSPYLHVAAAPWSRDPIDIAMLSRFDGVFSVKSDSVKYGGVAVANADLDAELKDGGIALRRFTGKMFGGDLTLDGGLRPEARGIGMETRYALGGADIGAAERAFGGRGASKGSLTSEGRLSGTGRSMAEIVASLAGEGALALRGVEMGDGAGSALSALGGIAGSLDRIGAAMGGRQKAGLLDLSGPYRVINGIVSFDELALTSTLGEGALKGKVDLPKWQVAAAGEIRLAKNLLTELVVRDPASAKPVPFEIEGALDAPRVKIDIAKLPGGGVRVPALDRLREKKGVGEVLDRLLPPTPKKEAPPAKSATPAPAAPTPQPQPEPKKTDRAQDILRDILKGIGR